MSYIVHAVGVMALTVSVANWSGAGYQRVSALQRTVAGETLAELVLGGSEWVLDIGCGDGYLTRQIADRLPGGGIVGMDASPLMVATAQQSETSGGTTYFVRADARRLPFGRQFDMVVSFNALHWVPQLDEALAEIAAVLRPTGRSVIQMVCAGQRPSIESTAMQVAAEPRWSPYFAGFSAPFCHVDPAVFADLAGGCGLRVSELTVRDREWDFGSREQFTAWCSVGSTAWSDRIPPEQRSAFVADLVAAYEPVTGRPGLFRFMQLRAELSV